MKWISFRNYLKKNFKKTYGTKTNIIIRKNLILDFHFLHYFWERIHDHNFEDWEHTVSFTNRDNSFVMVQDLEFEN